MGRVFGRQNWCLMKEYEMAEGLMVILAIILSKGARLAGENLLLRGKKKSEISNYCLFYLKN